MREVGALGWHSCLSVRLLISAQVDFNLDFNLRVWRLIPALGSALGSGVWLRFSLPHPLPFNLHMCTLSLSLK